MAIPTISGVNLLSSELPYALALTAPYTIDVYCSDGGYTSDAVVSWDGTALSTTFNSAGHLYAAVTAGLDTIGNHAIVVTQVSGVSSPYEFPCLACTIASITPNTVSINGAPLSLTITGANFDSSATVSINGILQSPGGPFNLTYISPTTATLGLFPTGVFSSVGQSLPVVVNLTTGSSNPINISASKSVIATPPLIMLPGPRYNFDNLPEGRKMACIDIDCTILPILALTATAALNLPEMVSNAINNFLQSTALNTFSALYYHLFEFDLANFLNGEGLSQVRSVMIYSRAGYGAGLGFAPPADFSVSGVNYGSPMLTLVDTRQTLSIPDSVYPTTSNQFSVLPFVGSGKSLKVRFLKFIDPAYGSAGMSYGRYYLQFCNFEVSPILDNSNANPQ